jgi:hypothetical protein
MYCGLDISWSWARIFCLCYAFKKEKPHFVRALALFCLGSKPMINWIYHWLGPNSSMGLKELKGLAPLRDRQVDPGTRCVSGYVNIRANREPQEKDCFPKFHSFSKILLFLISNSLITYSHQNT